MKKVWLILLILIIIQTPAYTANKRMEPTSGADAGTLPNIFIYAIPEDEPHSSTKQEEKEIKSKNKNSEQNEEIQLNIDDNTQIGATTLKGYAQYVEDAEEVYLKDSNDNFVLNIKVPQKISSSQSLDFKNYSKSREISRYKNSEYNIAPNSVNTQETKGDFTFGALYGNEVDNIAMLESETGLFTRYEKNKFALSSTYKKNLNTTYNQFYDTISIAPEFKLNNYMSIKNEYKADITRNRKSGALIFSINPFGKRDSDRMRLELGAKQTIFADNTEPKTEFSFSTRFKL